MIHPLLNVRTDFSLGESIIGIDDLPAAIEKAGADVIGVCDTMSVSSLVEASKKAKKLDKRLLVGVRIRVIMREGKEEEACYLKLYPTCEEGMQSIYRLLSRGFEEDRFYYVPRVTWDDMLATLSNGCLAISTGDLESVMQREDMQKALADLVQRVSFTARFYELVASDTPYFSRQNHRAIEWALLNNCFGTVPDWQPIVIQPAFWLDNAAETYSVNAGIAERRPYEDYLRPVPSYQPHTALELAQAAVAAGIAIRDRYKRDVGLQIKEGLLNTQALVDACQYEWSKQEPSLPILADDPDAELKELCKQGWGERFRSRIFDHQPSPAELAKDYLPRLQFELDTIQRQGFAQYFLLVADLVRWAKAHGIYVGPGRGSVGGSLIAYLTGITDVDPIRFGLLFERFINPDRLDLPDADLDFMSTRREEVIAYLVAKWGADKVAGIVNYNTMGARGVIKDVGRIYNLPGDQLSITKFVGDTHGVSAGLEEARAVSPEVDQFARQQAHIWDHALKLEGKMRTYGTHAAGVVVAGEPIVNRAVVERRGGVRVINWDKRVSEEQGLVKLDVLGLTTLDMFDHAIKLIWRRHTCRVDINALSLDDSDTLEIFNKAKTAGVFQFEGGSVRRLLKEMAAHSSLTFEDLVALNALNRPGPLDAGLCEAYIRRRAGQEAVTYPHPSLQAVLQDTYGVIVYQEQVMQVSRILCGFTPGEADMLRKIMGKKLPEEMKKQRDKFVQGAINTSGMPQVEADALFTMIEGFAGYAFNRSHAVEYTLIAYQAAWLKAHYLVEFYTASMGIAADDKLAVIVKQAKADGIRVIPPDINVSTTHFEPLNDVIIAAPLSAVKGVSEKGAAAIIAARNETELTIVEETKGRGKNKVTTRKTYGPGRFTSMEDFRARVEPRAVNNGALEKLDKVGAFSRVEPGQLPSTHASRQRDQIENMPALADQGVAADRKIVVCDQTWEQLVANHESLQGVFGDQAVDTKVGKDPKLMVILDAPFNDYEEPTSQYSYREFVDPSLRAAGLKFEDLVLSYVVRRPKRKGERDLPAVEITAGVPFLKRDVEILRPPVIVLLGAAAIKAFFPDIKRPSDAVGHKAFSAELDATVIIGFNPTQIYHDADKAEKLTAVFEEAKKLVDDA